MIGILEDCRQAYINGRKSKQLHEEISGLISASCRAPIDYIRIDCENDIDRNYAELERIKPKGILEGICYEFGKF